MNVLFTGGGTGGHVYPAIAIADALPDARVTFVGTAERMEAKIVPKAGYALQTVRAAPLVRSPLAALRAALVNVQGIRQSLGAIARVQPDIIIATGGYVCFPVVVAARILRALRRTRAPIALLLLEHGATPGLTNKLLAPLVDEVWVAHADDAARFHGKCIYTGVPIRASLRRLPTRLDAATRLGLDPRKHTLLAMGGSLGARTINVAVLTVGTLPEDWQVLLVVGDEATARNAQRRPVPGVTVRAYLDDPADAFAAADLVLARAGASTIAEVSALGLPAIFVPYPYHADDHQTANARALEAAGGAIVVPDAEMKGDRLAETLAELTSSGRLAALRSAARAGAPADAAAAILARIDALASRRA